MKELNLFSFRDRGDAEFSDLLGKTLVAIDVRRGMHDHDHVIFTTDDGKKYRQYHDQDCCEHVHIEDISGDFNDLIGTPMLMAEEVSQHGESDNDDEDESYTWTFYKLGTVNGYVTIRWYGSSNGYYSESVDFELLEAE